VRQVQLAPLVAHEGETRARDVHPIDRQAAREDGPRQLDANLVRLEKRRGRRLRALGRGAQPDLLESRRQGERVVVEACGGQVEVALGPQARRDGREHTRAHGAQLHRNQQQEHQGRERGRHD